jgi:hypothetical protein
MLRGVCLRTSPSSNAHIAPMAKIRARRARWIIRTCLLLMWSDSNHSEDAVIILSDDAHEKAMGALSKYQMAAPRRSK